MFFVKSTLGTLVLISITSSGLAQDSQGALPVRPVQSLVPRGSEKPGSHPSIAANPSASTPIMRPLPMQAKAGDEPNVHDCDRLAGSPFDPGRITNGVPFDKIDTASAIVSCVNAVKVGPASAARFQFEYGRALDAAKRYDEAMRWYRAAAGQGYSAAQVGLGFIYYYGHGVPRNYDEAIRWLRKAADQRNVQAENTIGVMYFNGEGVAQNYDEAMKWYVCPPIMDLIGRRTISPACTIRAYE
jgi:TPR repeat protein